MQVEVHSTLAAKMTTIIFEDSQSRRGNGGNEVKVTFTIESILSKFPNAAPSYLLASIDDENPHAAKKLYLKEKSMKNLMLELQSIDVKTNANDLAEKNEVLIKKKPYGGRCYSFLSLKTIEVESGEKHKIMMEHKIASMSSTDESLEKKRSFKHVVQLNRWNLVDKQGKPYEEGARPSKINITIKDSTIMKMTESAVLRGMFLSSSKDNDLKRKRVDEKLIEKSEEVQSEDPQPEGSKRMKIGDIVKEENLDFHDDCEFPYASFRPPTTEEILDDKRKWIESIDNAHAQVLLKSVMNKAREYCSACDHEVAIVLQHVIEGESFGESLKEHIQESVVMNHKVDCLMTDFSKFFFVHAAYAAQAIQSKGYEAYLLDILLELGYERESARLIIRKQDVSLVEGREPTNFIIKESTRERFELMKDTKSFANNVLPIIKAVKKVIFE